MKKDQKKKFVKDFKDIFNNVGILVVTHYSGLKTTQTDELRTKIKEVGGRFVIVKNSLMKIILKEHKSKEFKELFNGPVALAYSEDEVSAAKIAVNFSKENDKLLILGGIMGDKFLEQKDVLEIATLPSLDEIRAKLVSLIQTPARNIAYALKFSANKLARVFNEYSKLDIPEEKVEAEKKSEEKTETEAKTEKKPETEAKTEEKPETEAKTEEKTETETKTEEKAEIKDEKKDEEKKD
ncbi:MAG: 50S ribosomal protein L10 [Alphaproteobacteria bacterium MarineAlpha6_Bin6]|nr:MAG: 50S ribosomal protein L10 [Alphaproteobacteria bacterium MarineAlpha6_Bin6]PPR32655.1 MAG: 50S ribosomal protein L10 [Alphaproteobacteria bacterium MarineAlpha6_Bin5]|tara:strand:+ start:2363 stop:3079 length:717 start_codon:yes stop_codon:yes gene_type:complete